MVGFGARFWCLVLVIGLDACCFGVRFFSYDFGARSGALRLGPSEVFRFIFCAVCGLTVEEKVVSTAPQEEQAPSETELGTIIMVKTNAARFQCADRGKNIDGGLEELPS